MAVSFLQQSTARQNIKTRLLELFKTRLAGVAALSAVFDAAEHDCAAFCRVSGVIRASASVFGGTAGLTLIPLSALACVSTASLMLDLSDHEKVFIECDDDERGSPHPSVWRSGLGSDHAGGMQEGVENEVKKLMIYG